MKNIIRNFRLSINQRIGDFALKIMPSVARCRRSIDVSSAPERVLLIPPVWPASLGDEASLNAIADAVEKNSCELVIAGYREREEWLHIRGVRSGYDFRPFIWGGLSKSRAGLKACNELHKFDRLLVVGTDVMDGSYSEHDTMKRIDFMNVAASTGMPVETTGISCVKKPSLNCMDAYRNLDQRVFLRARDPISKSRLEKFSGRHFDLVADVAFLLKPESHSPLLDRCHEWIMLQKGSGRLVMVLNLCTHIIDNDPDQLSAALTRIRDVLVALNERQPIAILLLPHDYRYEFNDNTLNEALKEVCAKDPMAVKIPILNTGFPITAREVKSLTGMVDITVTGRMHVAIASLGMGKPIACTTYQDKFEGLFEHFNIKNLSIDGKAIWEEGALLTLLENAIESRNEQRALIEERLPEVSRLASLNTAGLMKL